MDVIIEIVAELLFQLVVEVLGAVGRKGLANVLARPWLQLVVSMAGAVGAGFAWTRLVRPDTLPLLVTSIVGAQWVLPALVGDRTVGGIRLTRARLGSLAAIGSAYAAGRWLGVL
jgi:hypothetical protein